MKLNTEQRLIVYIALLWAYENEEDGVAYWDIWEMSLYHAVSKITEGEYCLGDFPELNKLIKCSLLSISLLKKAIEEVEGKIG